MCCNSREMVRSLKRDRCFSGSRRGHQSAILSKKRLTSARESQLLFYYDYDFFIGKMTLKGDLKSIEKIISVDPASFVIGEVIDHYFYVRLTKDEMHDLSFSQSMTGKVGEIGFELPYACRDAWRTFLGN
jgi:hypothetical protein